MSEAVNDTPQPALPPPRRAWLRFAVFGTLMLVCGAVIGSGLTLIAIKQRVDEFRSRPDLLSERMMERMRAELQLTDNQADEIKKIFAESRKHSSEMRDRNRAQAQAFFREFQAKVAQVLTPAQQQQWEDWFRKARERAFYERGQRGRHGDHKDDDRRNGDDSSRGFRNAPGSSRDADSTIGPPPQGIPERYFKDDNTAPKPESPATPQ